MKLSEVIQKLTDAKNLFDQLNMDPDVVFDMGTEYTVINTIMSEIYLTGDENDPNIVLKH